LAGAARYQAYGDLDVEIMHDHAPLVPIDNGNARDFTAPHLGGYLFQPANGSADLNTFYDASGRNVISGNDGEGLDITNRPDNVVEGNYIGTNAAGNAAVPNTGDGIRFEDVSHQTIGGSAPGAGNLISGNGANGLFFNSGYEFTTGVIQGNTIGLAEDGKTPLPNGGDGIRAEGVGDDGVPIGGTVAGAGNVISGNHGNGITIDGSDGSRIRGNLIGTSADGLSGVPNASGGGAEVSIQDSSDVLVGGTTAAARNVISGGGSGAPG